MVEKIRRVVFEWPDCKFSTASQSWNQFTPETSGSGPHDTRNTTDGKNWFCSSFVINSTKKPIAHFLCERRESSFATWHSKPRFVDMPLTRIIVCVKEVTTWVNITQPMDEILRLVPTTFFKDHTPESVRNA